MTPTRANWLAPVNISSDSTQVCATLSPDGDRDGAEADAVRPGGEADRQAVADDPGALSGTEGSLGHAPRLGHVPGGLDPSRAASVATASAGGAALLLVEVVDEHERRCGPGSGAGEQARPAG